MPSLHDRSEAFTELINMLSCGYESVTIDFNAEDRTFDVYSSGRDLAPDHVGWTYAEGLDLPGVTDNTRLLDPCENLDTEAHFRYHLPTLDEWFDSDNPAAITIEWSPVEDSSLQYDDEAGCYRDEDDQPVEDNFVGHVYLMKVWN